MKKERPSLNGKSWKIELKRKFKSEIEETLSENIGKYVGWIAGFAEKGDLDYKVGDGILRREEKGEPKGYYVGNTQIPLYSIDRIHDGFHAKHIGRVGIIISLDSTFQKYRPLPCLKFIDKE